MDEILFEIGKLIATQWLLKCNFLTYKIRRYTKILQPAYTKRQVLLCSVHTYRMKADIENYTKPTGQEKHYSTVLIHGSTRITLSAGDKRSAIMQLQYLQN